MKQGSLIRSERRELFAAFQGLFREMGRASPRAVAEESVARGIVPPRVLQECQMRGLIEDVRLALKADTEDGLPFAKPIGNEDADWSQLYLFTYNVASILILREAAAVVHDYKKVRRLHEWCLVKFGRAPEIPEFREAELA